MARFNVSMSSPRARGVCDFCGFQYQHDQLRWSMQWQGPAIQNTRFLVCDSCWDTPQEQLRTILIPPDPLPIENPRPENYVSDNNPISGIGQNASPLIPYGTNFGTINSGAGTYAVFDGNVNKPFFLSAYIGVSAADYTNTVGKNWTQDPSDVLTPSVLTAPQQSYRVSSITMTAPNDAPFMAGGTSYRFQGSSDGETWTTLVSGTTDGSVAEAITEEVSGTGYSYHQLAFLGDGASPIAIAQLSITAANYPGSRND